MGVWAELLFGEGFWLGLILIVSLLFILSSVVTNFGYLGGILSILMFIVYYNNITANTFEYWGAIFMGMSSILFFYLGGKN